MSDKKELLELNQVNLIKQLEKSLNITLTLEIDLPTNKENYYVASEGNIIGLFLSNLKLKEIPKIIFQMTELISLEMPKNNLKDIPKEILSLKKLAILDLSYNLISNLPRWIYQLKLLRVLKLNNNQIYAIPDTISQMTLLRKLFLQNNQIHSLPFNLIELKLLEEIHMDFRTTMKKTIKGILNQLETNGCLVKDDYNRR
ncbi:MAG: leucine-rich repeat domain-containing protein [Asgard group archaeon]|nr:leucine-rich repeat domain-containing protein [Asgard group archaeon]